LRRQVAQRLAEAGGFEHHALAHVDGRSSVIDTDDMQGHQ
jgi:hypothetical protein